VRFELAWARAGEVPAGDDWLGPRERAVLAGLRAAPRRASWRLGRFAARRLLGDVEVLPGPNGAPRAWRGATRLPLAISLSHRGELAVCAAAAAGALGCDLELVEPRSAAFVAEFLTPAEQRRVAAADDPALAANLVWSAKESALKALGVGLTRDTRELEVHAASGGELVVTDLTNGERFAGWWREVDGYVVTVVTSSPVTTTPSHGRSSSCAATGTGASCKLDQM